MSHERIPVDDEQSDIDLINYYVREYNEKYIESRLDNIYELHKNAVNKDIIYVDEVSEITPKMWDSILELTKKHYGNVIPMNNGIKFINEVSDSKIVDIPFMFIGIKDGKDEIGQQIASTNVI